jgi:hypothetical protein
MELLAVGESLAEVGDGEALLLADALSPVFPVEAELVRARFYMRLRRFEDGTAALERAWTLLRADPWSWHLPVARSLDLGAEIAPFDPALAARLAAALAEPFAAMLLDEERQFARVRMALQAGGAAAVAAFGPYERHPIWERGFLEARESAYREAGDPRVAAAARDLEDYERDAEEPIDPEEPAAGG